MAKAFGVPKTLDFMLILGRDIGIGVLAHVIVDWLMTNFAGRANKLIIERTEVSFERGQLVKVVTETITSKQSDR